LVLLFTTGLSKKFTVTKTPLHDYRNTPAGDLAVRDIARQASQLGYNVTVCQAALWLLLHSSDRDGNRRRPVAGTEQGRLTDVTESRPHNHAQVVACSPPD